MLALRREPAPLAGSRRKRCVARGALKTTGGARITAVPRRPPAARAAGAAAPAHRVVPQLVVVSPMTRAIQTAALVFEHALLEQGVPLVVRPEIREYFPDSCENLGRPLADVASNQDLRELPAWGVVAAALEAAMAS